MKSRKKYKWLLPLLSLVFLMSCAPKVTFFVTHPPQLPVRDVEVISIGSFDDQLGLDIALPRNISPGSARLQPKIDQFKANGKASDLVRGMTVAGLSAAGQYRIINTGGTDTGYSGVIPDPSKTGVINAKVKYFEFTAEDSEEMFYLLMATKGGGSTVEQLQAMALRETAAMAARRAGKGFKVPTPYVEKVAAMQVEFDMVNGVTGDKIVPTQTLTSYFVQKWGGEKDTSHLPDNVKQVIVADYQQDQSMFETIKTQAGTLEMALLDPDEFLAQGKLKVNPSIPKNTLEIQARLAQQIVDVYLKRISRYTVETTLAVASGDAVAVNFINANAYELAINRLENLDRSEEDSFNLALAYESIAEYLQAKKYYQEALDKNPGNDEYKRSLRRVTQY